MGKQLQQCWEGARLREVTALLFTSLTLLGFVTPVHADTQVRSVSFEYTASGQVSKETQFPSTAALCLSTSYSYDGFGNRTSTSKSTCPGATGDTISSAAAPRTSGDTWTDPRFTTTSTNALGHAENKTWDARFGVLASLTGPNTLATTWNVDSFGRKTKETRADGTNTRWSYQACSEIGANCPGPIGAGVAVWVVSEQDYGANNATIGPLKRQYFDALGRIIRIQSEGFDAAGGVQGSAPTTVQDTQYNQQGLIARQSNWYTLGTESPIWTDYQYDSLGRIVLESRPDSAASGGTATTSTTYSALTTTITNPLGQTKTTTKNAQGLVASIVDALNSTLAYSYDAAGNLIQTNAAGSITAMQYDLRGRKVAMQDAAMGVWSYRYNAFDELVGQTDSLNQATSIAYDALGRMTQRSEPDLVSLWSYDQNFDATSCGKGVGKLCQAKADNGYVRSQHYDALGRIDQTSTALDNPSSPAVVTETFDANTGRVASKTWPTGYQASYSYSARGYLTSVDGGGTNGFTQASQLTRYQVLAMDAAGRVTQYKVGGKVTTVKNIDPATGRLLAQSATTDGQSSGNVLSQSYSYDALSNLKSRVDNTPNVGTQENFSYDSLNRLTLATILGGAVSPPQTTEVLYDARGNIAYKSDVGRYWYDPSRPNRMTNVTLESAPGATMPLTGTRQLSYAFDDYSAGAQSLNGVTVGNGNLTYTVTHDTTNSRHFVRYESYTSFNMPQSIGYANFAPNTSTCPQGYTLEGGVCKLTSASTTAATPVYSCPAGQTLTGTTCTLTTTSAATPVYSCASGYTLVGTGPQCSGTRTIAASPLYGCDGGSYYIGDGWCRTPNVDYNLYPATVVGYSCPSGYTRSGSSCSTTVTVTGTVVGYTCPSGQVLSGSTCSLTTVSNAAPYPATPNYSCASGYTLTANVCTKTNSTAATAVYGCLNGATLSGTWCTPPGSDTNPYQAFVVGYSCPAGYTLSGTTCSQTLSQSASIASYTCPSGRNLVGTGCVLPGATFVGYACPNGGTVNANTCTETRPLQTTPGSANAADRTLAFIYGPEHQRIRQSVTLSGNGTSSYFAGNTWYLNGTDSLGLTYEKEIRANGTTEHKHYLMAQGQVFALFTSRTGTLNGLSASTTNYFQHDQLGSISTITDENGVVTERLAYDPWGKRRFIASNPGKSDTLDTLIGSKTDRGYTEHEHLDEVGIIHMNGRIYDPLMGRFMSADPNVFHPENMKDFNRYSYVWNNPLKMWDPTGYNARDDSASGAGYGSRAGAHDATGVGGISNGKEDENGKWGSYGGNTEFKKPDDVSYVHPSIDPSTTNRYDPISKTYFATYNNQITLTILGSVPGLGRYAHPGYVTDKNGDMQFAGYFSFETDNPNLPGLAGQVTTFSLSRVDEVSDSRTAMVDKVHYGSFIEINNRNYVVTNGPNPNQNGAQRANGTLVHNGVTDVRTGSQNCITGYPGNSSLSVSVGGAVRNSDSSMSTLHDALNNAGVGIGQGGVLDIRR